jgi:hypothetical protein
MLACWDLDAEKAIARRSAGIIPETLFNVQNTAASTAWQRPFVTVITQEAAKTGIRNTCRQVPLRCPTGR